MCIRDSAYGVQELAVRYFPDVLPASATRHLTRLIRGDGELLDKLTQIGYKRGCRIYTPAMVHLIVRYLGLPQHYKMCIRDRIDICPIW